MNNKIVIIIAISLVFLFNGCQKNSAAKNAAMTPVAVAYGAGKVANDVFQIAILSPFAIIGALSSNDIEKKKKIFEKYVKEKKLTGTKIYIKDYTNEFDKIAMESLSKKLKEKEYQLKFVYEIDNNTVIKKKQYYTKSLYVREFMFPDKECFIGFYNDPETKLSSAILSKSNDSLFKFKIDTTVKTDLNGTPILEVNKEYNSLMEAYVDYLYINRTLIEYAKDDKSLYNISLIPDLDLLLHNNKLQLKFASSFSNSNEEIKQGLKETGASIVNDKSSADIVYHIQHVGITNMEITYSSETLLDKYFSDKIDEPERIIHKQYYMPLSTITDLQKDFKRLVDNKEHNLAKIKRETISKNKKKMRIKSKLTSVIHGYVDFKDSDKYDQVVFANSFSFASILYETFRTTQELSKQMHVVELISAYDQKVKNNNK